MPIVARTADDKSQELQRALYRAAKAEPGRRFHALYDKVHRRDVLERAWEQVLRNRGAAGIDHITLAEVERHGHARLLDELASDLKDGRYRPLPARRVWIPKPGSTERRPLSIPAVRDRIVQAAAKIVIEPVFEADFRSASFGFRPKRAAHDALQVLLDESFRGRRWVVETDIAECFEAIPYDWLMMAIEERVCDRKLLKLLRAMLRSGVLEDGTVRHTVTGTPQGGVISPLLCNVYLNRLDREWEMRGSGVLVRYADDLVVMCRTRTEAERALAALTAILADLGLKPKAAKTRIVHLVEDGEGFDFLGFHHRLVRARGRRGAKHIVFLARWPSRRATQHARDRIRELTARSRLLVPVERVVQDVNRFLRGWAAYFRIGNSARTFDKVMTFAVDRLALFVAKLHHRSRRYGWSVYRRSPDRMGLINLNGTVVAPRPNRAWRVLVAEHRR
ncbi:MAG: group II intron reverse transcriptase/maturase [Actinomycetota bacterium]